MRHKFKYYIINYIINYYLLKRLFYILCFKEGIKVLINLNQYIINNIFNY
jgi:hypothetical protein